MTKECCRDCRYCHALKELAFGRWIMRSCCTFWVETEPKDGYTSWVQVVDEYGDKCECFTPREEATKKLITGGIEDVIAELESKRSTRYSIVCSPIVRKVLEDAIPKSLSSNALFYSTPHLNGTDSIYVFDGDITDPKWYADKIPITFGEETDK